MDTFWAECYELSQVASHMRNREIGESKLKFETMYLEPFLNLVSPCHVSHGFSTSTGFVLVNREEWKMEDVIT